MPSPISSFFAACTLLILSGPSGRLCAEMMNIQDRLDNAVPGDIVEVPGGIYFERLHFPKAGEPGKPITLRGMANEIVVINAGRLLETNFKPVSGLPEVFSGKVSGINDETGIWEAATRLRLKRVGSREECARRLGSWYYEPESGIIYLRSSGAGSADKLQYWLEADEPAVTAGKNHVRLENLWLTLGGHGVLIPKETRDVQVSHCRAYCNKRSGIHISGDGHLISGNEVFANNQHGIQTRYEATEVTIRRNHCYHNGPRNGDYTDIPEPVDLSLYSRSSYVLIEENIVEGFTKNAFRSKYGETPANVFRHNVIRGNNNPAKDAGYNNTFIAHRLGPRAGMYLRAGREHATGDWESADPTGLQRAANLIYPADFSENPLFADLAYSDYRLQAGSPAMGKGAYPGFSPVFYIDPAKGAPDHDGLSAARPMASLSIALERAPAGSTLYLLPGEYREDVKIIIGGLSAAEPLRIRAHGRSEEVKIMGKWTVAGNIGVKAELNVSTGAAHIELDGLHFQSGSLKVEKTPGFTMRRVIFESSALEIQGCEGTRLDQNTFIGSTVKVQGRHTGALSRSLLIKTSMEVSDDALVSAFNYTAEDFSFAPQFLLPPGSPLAAAAPDFGPIGARGESRQQRTNVEGLRVAGLHPHGATLLWESPRQNTFSEVTLRRLPDGAVQNVYAPMEFEVMGKFFDMIFLHEAFFGVERHLSLGALEPATTYEAALTPLDYAGIKGAPVTLTFTTPSENTTSRTFYLSSKGSDDSDGQNRQGAWKTFHHALDRLSPGDTLIVLPGKYHEVIRPRISGTKDLPIRIVAEKSGTAEIALTSFSRVAIEILNTDYISVEGFYIKERAYGSGTNIVVNNARGIVIRGCETGYPPHATFAKYKLGASGLVATDAPDLLVADNLFIGAVIGIGVSSSPGAVIEHNTLLLGGNYGVVIVPGGPEEMYTVRGNLFDRATMDYKKNPSIRLFAPVGQLVSNDNLFHIPADHHGGIGEASGEVSFTLEEWQKASGLDDRSLFATPLFVAPEEGDFRLLPNSPGKGHFSDGSDIGMRK